jgi:hypothetical protein
MHMYIVELNCLRQRWNFAIAAISRVVEFAREVPRFDKRKEDLFTG